MLVDKKLDLPGGTVHFKGELTDDQVDIVMGFGLAIMLSRGLIGYKVVDAEGNVMEAAQDEPTFLTEDPDHGDEVLH
jgi:hypothetical protein